MKTAPTPTADLRPLVDLAQVIRSKNAGPTQLTIDIFMRDGAAYALAAVSPAMSRGAIAQRYGVAEHEVQRHLLADICAIKYVLPRHVVAGSPGDGDVYGAQQHGPMLDIRL